MVSKKELWWRAYWGYGACEYIRVDIENLARVKYAMLHKKMVSTSCAGEIDGGRLWRVEPDHRHYTGWCDSYQYGTAEDRKQIERDCPPSVAFIEAERRAALLVEKATSEKTTKYLSVPLVKDGEDIATLGMRNNELLEKSNQ